MAGAVLSAPLLLPVRAGQVVVGAFNRMRRRRLNYLKRARSSFSVPFLAKSRRDLGLEPFHAKRARAWTAPQRALETLEPWAHLRVVIDTAKDLPSSAPYVDIFVNDDLKYVGEHGRQAWASHYPFEASVGIHSPLSIVRIMVMDEAAESSFLGFVEFRVGDLVPNDPEPVRGWFELRQPRRLLGTGRARFRAHSRSRDDQAARPRRFPGSGADRPNAGEIHMSLQLDAAYPDDEWYAMCLPRPAFTIFHRYSELDDKINSLDVMDLWRDIAAIRRLVWDKLWRNFESAWTYVTSWQCPVLSAAMLAWWLVACWIPRCFLPTVPVWVAIWLFLLRSPRWSTRILAHQATAPLDEEGFRLVAGLGDTQRVAFWVERVVRDQGGQVLSLKALHRFSALIYRDRKPLLTFKELLKSLRTEPCVKWPAQTAPLNAEGYVIVAESRNARWAHQWLAQVVESRDGLVQDQGKLQRLAASYVCTGRGGVGPAAAAAAPGAFDALLEKLRGQNWIVWRDHGLGEETGGPNDAGWWARIPSWMIPRAVERLAYRIANPTEDLRKTLARFFRTASTAFEKDSPLARRIYLRCAQSCVLLSCASWWLDVSQVLWTVLGIAIATHRLPGVRQALTARRANSDLAECRQRREAGVENVWAFFRLTDGRPRPANWEPAGSP